MPALRFRKHGKWTVDLKALKCELAAGTLAPADRAFIETVLPGFCDFAEGKITSWPPRQNPPEAA